MEYTGMRYTGMEKNRIKHFTDLIVYQTAHKLALAVYQITKKFPPDERFGLTNQVRRASVSVTSNISEGFSRTTARDKIQFYTIAKGSLAEIESQLMLARDLGYITNRDFSELKVLIESSSKLLVAFMRTALDK